MATQAKSPVRLSFGPYTVDAATGQLSRSGVRVRLAGQPYRILLALLARPGELVTREQLRDEVWTDATFVDFDQGLNAAVNKLRRALGDAAENPRYIETHPGRGYRFVGTLKPDEGSEAELPANFVPAATASDQPMKAWWWVAGGAACLVSFAVGWRLREAPKPPPPWKLTQLTQDNAISSVPAISPDGKLVVYSSNRGPDGEPNLYLKPVSGGEPIRLTSDGAGNTMPVFTPDGSKIIYESTREGGGIYEIPTFGGEPRLLAKNGLNPTVSPDGSQVAYWIGSRRVAISVAGSGSVWVVPEAGGQPRQVGTQFTSARFPIWSRDGKRLLVAAYTASKPADTTAIDWWVVDVDGKFAARTGVYAALAKAAIGARDPATPRSLAGAVPYPGCWLPGSNSVIFSTAHGDTTSIWETAVSPVTGKTDGVFKRLTAGTGSEMDPYCTSADMIAFSNSELTQEIWSQAIDLDRAIPAGARERLTQGPAAGDPTLSADGRFLAYRSVRSGAVNIWLRDLATGQDTQIASSPDVQRFPVVSATGSRIAFATLKDGNRAGWVWNRDGSLEKICDGCLRVTSWSADEQKLLTFGGTPYEVDMVDAVSRKQTALLKQPKYNLLYARFSPAGGWVSFTARTDETRGFIAIAPLGGPVPIPESAWIRIADESAEDFAQWSPDGNVLYFTSKRDGHSCLWAQRLDSATHRPAGEAFAVEHFHGRTTYRHSGWSVAAGRMVVALAGGTTNVWVMTRSGPN